MVYKKYIKKKGKTFGPYYYESYRSKDGKVRTRYLGEKLPKRYVSKKARKQDRKSKATNKNRKWLYFSPLIALLVLAGLLVPNFLELSPTGQENLEELASLPPQSEIPENPVPEVIEIGPGTPEDPYIIETCQELQDINKDLNAHYALGMYIDCSDTLNWNDGEGFIPIGSAPSNPFSGTLDGRGHIVFNVHINQTIVSEGYELFGHVGETGEIKDLFLESVDIIPGKNI